MWQNLFSFSKGERRGIYLLLILIVAGRVASYFVCKEPSHALVGNEETAEAYRAFTVALSKEENNRSIHSFYPEKRTIVLAPFDPNTTDSVSFIRLGLPPFMVTNILHYREKGGVFRSVEAFAKIYGLKPKQYAMLRPYIYIGEAFCLKKDTLHRRSAADSLKYYKHPEGTLVDLNGADTTELKKIPGIGSGLARAVVAYRNRLGGFYRVEQLQDKALLPVELNRWFSAVDPRCERINLNKVSLERLRSHPYFSFYQARVVMEHRKKYGAIKSLRELKLYTEFTLADFERMEFYVCFE